MSHCVHFLSRLERVSMVHADFALELYRNPGVVRALMAEFSGIYDGERRAALALGKDGAGPYVVIAVDGGFVTCLGKGMKPRGLTVIKRELLESRRMFNQDMSAAVERYKELAIEGGVSRLFRRVVSNGPHVCREDVEQIIAILPVLKLDFIEHLLSMSAWIVGERDKVVQVIEKQRNLSGRKAERTKRIAGRAAAAHWKSVWSIATCHAIVAAGGEHSLMSMYFTETDELGPVHEVSLLEGHAGLALRSLWGAGMRGAAVVGLYEEGLDLFDERDDVIGHIASLTIAALRHRHLRERVDTHLEGIASRHGVDPLIEFVLLCARTVLNEDAKVFYGLQLLLGQEVYKLAVRERLSPNHPDYYQDAKDVPEALLCTLAISLQDYFHGQSSALYAMFICLPWLAKARVGDLFLPRRLNDTLLAVGPKQAEQGMALLSMHCVDQKCSSPVVKDGQVGRNDPCPCKSGRKFKQCCLNRAPDRVAVNVLEFLSPS